MHQFYVYVIFRPDGIPCYVGKGKADRWKRVAHKRNPHLRNILKLNPDLPVVVIRDGLTESEAFRIEVAFIAAIGRQQDGGPLVNVTSGGEGAAGIRSPFKGKKRSPEFGAGISLAKKGKSVPHLGQTFTADTRAKIADAARKRLAVYHPMRGKAFSEEARKARTTGYVGMLQEREMAGIPHWNAGRVFSAEHRAALSAAAKNRRRRSPP